MYFLRQTLKVGENFYRDIAWCDLSQNKSTELCKEEWNDEEYNYL